MFVNGFLMVTAGEVTVRPFMFQHLQELMEDVELYRWEQQLEQCRVTWANEEHKMKYHRALIWHHMMAPSQPTSVPHPTTPIPL